MTTRATAAPAKPRTSLSPGLAAAALGAAALSGPLVSLAPFEAVLVAASLALVGAVAAHPPLAAYAFLAITPLVVGMDRGSVVPLMRPNEAFFALLAVGVAIRYVVDLVRERRPRPPLRLPAVDAAILALAVLSSVVPLLWMVARDKAIGQDDVLFALTLWKYYAVYLLFRSVVRTAGHVRVCLWTSMAVAALVAVVAILQSRQMFGVHTLLARNYAPEADVGALDNNRGTSTLASSIAVADLMLFNLAIALAWLARGSRHRVLLAAAAVLFLFGVIAAGQFSGMIGLVAMGVTLGVVTGWLRQLVLGFIPLAAMAGLFLRPVIERRLLGFSSREGVPPSWVGRWENLQRFFFPELFSDFNWVLGVRVAARVKAPERWRNWVWMESGHTWLLWTGGIPLLVAFGAFLWVTMRTTLRVARRRADEFGVVAVASFASLVVIAVLMVFDVHLTLRGSADLSFPLLAMAVAGLRAAPAPAGGSDGGGTDGSGGLDGAGGSDGAAGSDGLPSLIVVRR